MPQALLRPSVMCRSTWSWWNASCQAWSAYRLLFLGRTGRTGSCPQGGGMATWWYWGKPVRLWRSRNMQPNEQMVYITWMWREETRGSMWMWDLHAPEPRWAQLNPKRSMSIDSQKPWNNYCSCDFDMVRLIKTWNGMKDQMNYWRNKDESTRSTGRMPQKTVLFFFGGHYTLAISTPSQEAFWGIFGGIGVPSQEVGLEV